MADLSLRNHNKPQISHRTEGFESAIRKKISNQVRIDALKDGDVTEKETATATNATKQTPRNEPNALQIGRIALVFTSKTYVVRKGGENWFRHYTFVFA